MKKRVGVVFVSVMGLVVSFVLLRALILAMADGQVNVGNYGRVQESGPSSSLQTPQDKLLSKVRWEQKLQNQLPFDAQFKDENGRSVRFGQYFNGQRPVVLAMIFYNCTMLCSEVLNGMMTSMKEVKLVPGQDFDVVIVSINPNEGPALAKAKKQNYLAEYGLSEDAKGFHFLTGTKVNIDKVTNAAGYFYQYDKRSDQYAHPGGIVVATPQGQVARYFTGVLYAPRDVRLGLVDAAQGKVGSITDLVLLRCFHYDASTGKYTLAVMEVVRIMAMLFLIALGSFVVVLVRRDMQKEQKQKNGLEPSGTTGQV